MFTLLLFTLLVVALSGNATAKLWDPNTDPVPPVQPKEVGMQTYNSQFYHIVDTGAVLFNLQIPGYQFESYANQVIIAYATGEDANANPPAPIMQYAWNNYSSGQNLLAQYPTQGCYYGTVEGHSPYPGYDFYSNYIYYLYQTKMNVTFEYITLPDYGLCLKYTSPVPWNNPDLPRNMVYTLVYQNSTGYLLQYNLIGTEYCCANGAGCPNEGQCADGTDPVLTLAMTNQTLFGYQIFTEDSWPKGFFNPYCPFTSSTPVTSSSSSDSHLRQGDAFAILFGLLFFGAAAVSVVMLFRMQEMSIKIRDLESKNKDPMMLEMSNKY
jgi:hypothetical protein